MIMENNSNILSEIKEISPLLATLKDKNVFRVPYGYFEALPDRLMDKISTKGFDLGQKVEVPALEVPKGYFDGLSSEILKKIRSEKIQTEEDELADFPMLKELKSKENVLTVPAGYFHNLPHSILKDINKPVVTKVIPLYRRPVFRYAVAAVVMAFLVVSVFFTNNLFNQQDSFAVVNKNTVSDKAALKYDSEKSFENGIASLSDDQIIAYLENHGGTIDEDQLILNTNQLKMPDPIDYLVDDEALDNYIKGIAN